jgi:hypothetical protein
MGTFFIDDWDWGRDEDESKAKEEQSDFAKLQAMLVDAEIQHFVNFGPPSDGETKLIWWFTKEGYMINFVFDYYGQLVDTEADRK